MGMGPHARNAGMKSRRSPALHPVSAELCRCMSPDAMRGVQQAQVSSRGAFHNARELFRWDHLQRKDRCCGVTSPFVFAMVQIPSIIRDVEIEAWAERRLSAVQFRSPCAVSTVQGAEYTL